MRGARAFVAVIVGSGVVAFAPVADEVLPELSRTELRVMTWNVLGSADPDPGAIAAQIVRRRVDVAALQEIEETQTLELEAHLREIDPRWRAVWHATGHDPGGGLPFTPPMEGHAILSRLSTTGARSWGLPQRDFHERILQRVVVTIGDDELYVYNTHLCRTPAFAFQDRACWARDQAGRAAQVRAVLRRVREDASAQSVLLGDLNARPGSPPVELLGGFMRDTGVMQPSRTRIDYVFVRGLYAERAASPPTDLSDHRPVIAELSLVGP